MLLALGLHLQAGLLLHFDRQQVPQEAGRVPTNEQIRHH